MTEDELRATAATLQADLRDLCRVAMVAGFTVTPEPAGLIEGSGRSHQQYDLVVRPAGQAGPAYLDIQNFGAA